MTDVHDPDGNIVGLASQDHFVKRCLAFRGKNNLLDLKPGKIKRTELLLDHLAIDNDQKDFSIILLKNTDIDIADEYFFAGIGRMAARLQINDGLDFIRIN